MSVLEGNASLTMIQGAKSGAGSLDGEVFGAGASELASVSSAQPAISLQAVLAANVSVAWDESVSIIEALCQAVQGSVLRTIPAANEIFLNGSGTVAVRSGSGTPEPVDAGRHLLDLLGKGTVPAPLRLFASQAVRAEQHGSIAEFQQGLDYFAKPGGRARIIAVFERCSKELAAIPFPAEGETPVSKALDKAEPKSARRGPWRWAREAVIATGAIIGTVFVVWAGYFAWQELSKPSAIAPPVADVEAKASTATDRPTGAATSSRPSVRQSDPVARPQVNAPAVSAVAPRLNSIDLGIEGQPVAEPAPAIDEVGGSSTPAATATTAPAAPLFVQDVAAEPVDVDRLYTSSDPGLVPATLVREQLLPPAMGAPLAGVAPLQIEILVSAEGTVERARFLAPPRRMADMMLLSSAKMWQFNPALKDGRPVRSRVVMSWLVAP